MGLSKRPSYAELIKMAHALDCSPEWLQSNVGEGPRANTFVPAGPPLPKPRVSIIAGKGSAIGSGLSNDEIMLFERDARQLSQRASALGVKRARK